MYIPLLASPEPQLNRKAKCIFSCDGDSYKPLTCVLSTSGLSAVVGAVLRLDTGGSAGCETAEAGAAILLYLLISPSLVSPVKSPQNAVRRLSGS